MINCPMCHHKISPSSNPWNNNNLYIFYDCLNPICSKYYSTVKDNIIISFAINLDKLKISYSDNNIFIDKKIILDNITFSKITEIDALNQEFSQLIKKIINLQTFL